MNFRKRQSQILLTNVKKAKVIYRCVLIYQYKCEVLILNEQWKFSDIIKCVKQLWYIPHTFVLSDLDGNRYKDLLNFRCNFSNLSVIDIMKRFQRKELIVCVKTRNEDLSQYHLDCSNFQLSVCNL